MNVSVPHELYRTPRLRQAARTLHASGRERGGQRQRVTDNQTHLDSVGQVCSEKFEIEYKFNNK